MSSFRESPRIVQDQGATGRLGQLGKHRNAIVREHHPVCFAIRQTSHLELAEPCFYALSKMPLLKRVN
jgi:hypothetical protein